jgi:hypothetical protein
MVFDRGTNSIGSEVHGFFILFFVVLGFELRAYTLSQAHGFFRGTKLSFKNYVQPGSGVSRL